MLPSLIERVNAIGNSKRKLPLNYLFLYVCDHMPHGILASMDTLGQHVQSQRVDIHAQAHCC